MKGAMRYLRLYDPVQYHQALYQQAERLWGRLVIEKSRAAAAGQLARAERLARVAEKAGKRAGRRFDEWQRMKAGAGRPLFLW